MWAAAGGGACTTRELVLRIQGDAQGGGILPMLTARPRVCPRLLAVLILAIATFLLGSQRDAFRLPAFAPCDSEIGAPGKKSCPALATPGSSKLRVARATLRRRSSLGLLIVPPVRLLRADLYIVGPPPCVVGLVMSHFHSRRRIPRMNSDDPPRASRHVTGFSAVVALKS